MQLNTQLALDPNDSNFWIAAAVVGAYGGLMSETISPEDTVRRARELLDARVRLVEDLARLVSENDAAQAAANQAERTLAAAYVEAERAGWTAGELSTLGIKRPERRAPGRPRTARRAATVAPAQPND